MKTPTMNYETLIRITKAISTIRDPEESIDILKTMQDPRTLRDKRRTPYEGVPKSFPKEDKELTHKEI